MTGVEAVSNGVDAFREPCVTNARRTLAAIVVTLGILLGGIAYLAMSYGIMAMDQTQPSSTRACCRSSSARWPGGTPSITPRSPAPCASCASPRTRASSVCRGCAISSHQMGLVPAAAVPTVGHQAGIFHQALSISALTAGLLLTAFDEITDRFIPLFAIGAFLTFTMSQTGMVVHWRRALRRGRSQPERRRVWLSSRHQRPRRFDNGNGARGHRGG